MIRPYHGYWPRLGKNVYIADGAVVIGEARLGDEVSIWPNAVVRADVFTIEIGRLTNVQDFTMIHATEGKFRTRIGQQVTIGHHATLHGCTVEDRALIGMGATVLDGAIVGEEAMVGAGALVAPGKAIPPRTLAVGMPAKPVRDLTDAEIKGLVKSADHYAEMARDYLRLRG